MIKHWEEFAFGPRDPSRELHVTLNRKGEIVIGAAAVERFGRPGYATLLFDSGNSLIGLAPTGRVGNAYPLVEKKGAKHRVVRAKRFCRHHGIEVSRTVAFHKPEIDEDGILVLNITKTRVIGKPG